MNDLDPRFERKLERMESQRHNEFVFKEVEGYAPTTFSDEYERGMVETLYGEASSLLFIASATIYQILLVA